MVISATTKARDLKLICNNFRCMNYNRLIFTKLDETDSFGILLNGVYLTGLPVIYLSTGQNVPDDICLADKDKISSLILGRRIMADQAEHLRALFHQHRISGAPRKRVYRIIVVASGKGGVGRAILSSTWPLFSDSWDER